MNTELETLPLIDVEKLDTAKPLLEIFQPFQTTLAKWEAKVESLVVTDINQKTEMAQARLARLELKEARVNMDKTRKGLVENLKARTGNIDATARVIREKIETLEARLLEFEEFADRYAAKVKAQLKARREAEVAPFLDAPLMIDLSDWPEEKYQMSLAEAKLFRQSKIDAAAKVEADRKAKEEADRLERERIAAENARLKADAAENARLVEIERKRIEAERETERRKAQEETNRKLEAARKEQAEALAKAKVESDRLAEIAAKERKRIEAKAKADAEEAAKARAELAAKAKIEAEEKARIEAVNRQLEKAKRDADLAPDRAKLQAFANAVRCLVVPNLKSIDVDLSGKVEEWAKWVEEQIEEAPE